MPSDKDRMPVRVPVRRVEQRRADTSTLNEQVENTSDTVIPDASTKETIGRYAVALALASYVAGIVAAVLGHPSFWWFTPMVLTIPFLSGQWNPSGRLRRLPLKQRRRR